MLIINDNGRLVDVLLSEIQPRVLNRRIVAFLHYQVQVSRVVVIRVPVRLVFGVGACLILRLFEMYLVTWDHGSDALLRLVVEGIAAASAGRPWGLVVVL